MNKLEYISKNCMQCVKDLDECHNLVLGIHEFAHKIADNSLLMYEFLENGVAFLLPVKDSPDSLPYVVASMVATDYSDIEGDGLVICIDGYSRFIPRCDFSKMSLGQVTTEMYDYLMALHPEVFSYGAKAVDFNLSFICFVIGCIIGCIFTGISIFVF